MPTIKPGSTEIRHLRYFLAVAETGHFRRAASALHVSQPTLSHQIRQLELQMGAVLFERLTRTVRLTAAGQALHGRAVAIMRELGDARRAIAELQSLDRGHLRVGIVSTIDVAVMPQAVGCFHRRFPGITVSIRELPMEVLEEELLAGRLDLGVSLLHARTRGHLATEALFEERLVAVLPADHTLAKRRSVGLGTMLDQPLVLLCPGFCTRELVAESADALGLSRGALPAIEMNSIEAVLATVRRTRMATLLPNNAVRWTTHKDLRVVPLSDDPAKLACRRVGLLWVSGGHRSAAALAFAREVRKTIGRKSREG